jgi:hypothetical protein
MRKLLVFLTGMILFLQYGYGQKQTWTADFATFTPYTPASGYWAVNATYAVPGSSSLTSYRGAVPSQKGDSIYLETPSYNCSGYNYVFLRFNHICKVSPRDAVKIQYREVGTPNWITLTNAMYRGVATNYGTTGFNAASYTEWNAGDSTEMPSNTWWKAEVFDISQQATGKQVEFRFVINRKNVTGTNISYGWL